MHNVFSFENENSLSKEIINFVANKVNCPKNGKILDIGCGSGALTIACAKKNPAAQITGTDIWAFGFEFSKNQCQNNALAENVKNVNFIYGDAKKLDFSVESFDAITSNYVFHNITTVKDKKEILNEAFRVLKKGGSFAIHDLITPARYGDMEKYIKELKATGFQKIELIETTKG